MAFTQPPNPENYPPTEPAQPSERRVAALKIIKEMVPEWDAAAGLAAPPTFGSALEEFATDFCFGDLWTRTGLSRKDRSLVTVALLIGSSRWDELRFHFPAAVRNGNSVEEIDEVIVHATGYAGFPAAATARRVALESLGKAGLLKK